MADIAVSSAAPPAQAEEDVYVLQIHTVLILLGLSLSAFTMVALSAGHRAKHTLVTGTETWYSLGISIFASYMGSWILLFLPSMSIYNSWFGMIGCTCGILFPTMVFCWIGPLVKAGIPNGSCLCDWIKLRYGVLVQVVSACISFFLMCVMLCAELISLREILFHFSGIHSTLVIIPVALVTCGYTASSGLPGSIATDWLQGFIIIMLAIIVLLMCMKECFSENITLDWNPVILTSTNIRIFFLTSASMTHSTYFNMGIWQRILVAKDTTHLRKGFLFGAVLCGAMMMAFGFIGMVSEAYHRGKGENFNKDMAFFELLPKNSSIVASLVVLLTCSLVCSSMDSLQNGILSLIAVDVIQPIENDKQKKFAAAAFVFLTNIPAVCIALVVISITSVFGTGNLLASTSTFPLMLGLSKFVTTRGGICGCLAGFMTISFFGVIIKETEKAKGLYEVWTMDTFLEWKFVILFCIIGPLTGAVSVGVSWIERRVVVCKDDPNKCKETACTECTETACTECLETACTECMEIACTE